MLLLDAGNSRLKWVYVRDGAWAERGTVDLDRLASLAQTFAGLPEPARILASNVAGSSAADGIRAACARWARTVEFVRAARAQCGVRNDYHTPEQLGSDRWAALIAAWERQRAACLVVNCGTATTVDALSADGKFRGGLILPGIDMMRNALAAGTAQLDLGAGAWEEFPRDTAHAIYSGAVNATVGAILRQHALLRAPQAACVLDGGAADLIAPHLDLPVIRVDGLVLRGLQLIGQDAGGIQD